MRLRTVSFFWKIVNKQLKNVNKFLKIEKNWQLSNTFWLYQHRVRKAYFQSNSHKKFQILIWVTLYLLLWNQEYPFPPFCLFVPSYCIEGSWTTETNFAQGKRVNYLLLKEILATMTLEKCSKRFLTSKRSTAIMNNYNRA